MAWQPLPVETDPDIVTARILDALIARGVLTRPIDEADPLVAFAEELGRETAALRALARDAAAAAVAGFGTDVHQVPALPGAAATLRARLTLTGAGAVAPANLVLVGRTVDGVDVAFTLPSDATAGGDGAVEVTLVAAEIGDVANGVPAGPLTVVTATATVSGATALASSTGGVDPETQLQYLDRLVAYLATLRPGGVLPDDIAVLARSVTGVHRALVIDLFDADTGLDNQARTATVYPIDIDGATPSASVLTALETLLATTRETGFVFRLGTPTRTPVRIAYTAVAETGADAATVLAELHAAAAEFIHPGRFAGGVDPKQPVWRPITSVRYLDLARALGSVPGVAYMQNLTINGAQADLALPGRAPLPASLTAADPSTIAGTVV